MILVLLVNYFLPIILSVIIYFDILLLGLVDFMIDDDLYDVDVDDCCILGILLLLLIDCCLLLLIDCCLLLLIDCCLLL